MRTVTRDGRGWMPIIVSSSLLATLSGCVATAPDGGGLVPSSGVQLVAQPDHYDFGTVDNGPIVTHVFKLKNFGPDTIEIKSVSGACGCTAILASTQILAPGQEGGVEVALDIYKLSGEQSKTITVHSSDPVRPELPLSLHGFVATDMRAAPSRLFLGRLPVGAVVSQQFEVRLERPDVQITGVSSQSERFAVESAPLDPPLHGVRVRVTLLPTATTGTFDDRIVVSSSSERQPQISVPVLGSIEGQEIYAGRRSAAATR